MEQRPTAPAASAARPIRWRYRTAVQAARVLNAIGPATEGGRHRQRPLGSGRRPVPARADSLGYDSGT